MRAPFQGSEIVVVEAATPAIKSLPADAEVPAGACGVSSVEEVEKHPLKPCLCGPAYTLSEARQLARLGKLIPSDLAHPDTLPSVTNHSERAHEARGRAQDSLERSARIRKPPLRASNATLENPAAVSLPIAVTGSTGPHVLLMCAMRCVQPSGISNARKTPPGQSTQ